MLFNDLFCLRTPGVVSISVGAAEPDQFDEHLKAVKHLGDDEPQNTISLRLEDEMEQITGYRRPDSFFDWFPNYIDTPGYINIPLILWLDSLARGWDLVDYARSRYRKLGHDAPWVPGNNSSLSDRYRFYNTLRNSPFDNDGLTRQLLLAHSRLL